MRWLLTERNTHQASHGGFVFIESQQSKTAGQPDGKNSPAQSSASCRVTAQPFLHRFLLRARPCGRCVYRHRFTEH